MTDEPARVSLLERALSEVIEALRTGPPECIGYGPQSQAAFAHGWNALANHLWESTAEARRLAGVGTTNPQTRAHYLIWAPMLIAAEEHHAGRTSDEDR